MAPAAPDTKSDNAPDSDDCSQTSPGPLSVTPTAPATDSIGPPVAATKRIAAADPAVSRKKRSRAPSRSKSDPSPTTPEPDALQPIEELRRMLLRLLEDHDED